MNATILTWWYWSSSITILMTKLRRKLKGATLTNNTSHRELGPHIALSANSAPVVSKQGLAEWNVFLWHTLQRGSVKPQPHQLSRLSLSDKERQIVNMQKVCASAPICTIQPQSGRNRLTSPRQAFRDYYTISALFRKYFKIIPIYIKNVTNWIRTSPCFTRLLKCTSAWRS